MFRRRANDFGRVTSAPAPVVLLKQVCPEAQKRPLPQSIPAGAMVGSALAQQRRARAQTTSVAAFILNVLRVRQSMLVKLFVVSVSYFEHMSMA